MRSGRTVTRRGLLHHVAQPNFAGKVIVTAYTVGERATLPISMLSELVWPRRRPLAYVVTVFVIAVTLVPILVAHRVTEVTETVAGGGR